MLILNSHSCADGIRGIAILCCGMKLKMFRSQDRVNSIDHFQQSVMTALASHPIESTERICTLHTQTFDTKGGTCGSAHVSSKCDSPLHALTKADLTMWGFATLLQR